MSLEIVLVRAEAQVASEQEAIRYLQQVADGLASKGLSIRWELLKGDPDSAVAGLAQELSDNIIALASHGRSGLPRWAQGSLAEDLIRATGDPVLVIPAELAEETMTPPASQKYPGRRRQV